MYRVRQGLRRAGILQGVRAMAARVYAGEDWYVQDDGGTGRIECLYERARRGVGAVKFVVARLTGENRWANDERRAARTDDEQGDLAPGGAGGHESERSTVDSVGGSAEVGAQVSPGQGGIPAHSGQPARLHPQPLPPPEVRLAG